MSILPASLVVNVTVRAHDNFAPRRGFGVPIFLTSVTKAGILDTDNRVKAYGSIAEVADDWATTDPFYIAALAMFSQNPRPILIKAGWYNAATALDAATMQTELNTIAAEDGDWYWLLAEDDLRDSLMAQGIITWTEAEERMAILATNDELIKDDEDDTNIAAVNKGSYAQTAVIYSSTPAEYPDAALAAVLATYNLDDADSSYTGAFKRLRTISVENISVDQFKAITGLTPGVGADTDDGHMANVFTNIGGVPMVQTGTTLTANTFIDEIHFRHWLTSRCREEILNVFANNRKVPYTDQGMQMLAGAVRVVMSLAARNGGLAADIDMSSGDYEPAFRIVVPSVFDVPESQRKNRVAPAIEVTFRYSGAVHFTTINFNITF